MLLQFAFTASAMEWNPQDHNLVTWSRWPRGAQSLRRLRTRQGSPRLRCNWWYNRNHRREMLWFRKQVCKPNVAEEIPRRVNSAHVTDIGGSLLALLDIFELLGSGREAAAGLFEVGPRSDRHRLGGAWEKCLVGSSGEVVGVRRAAVYGWPVAVADRGTVYSGAGAYGRRGRRSAEEVDTLHSVVQREVKWMKGFVNCVVGFKVFSPDLVSGKNIRIAILYWIKIV